MGVILFDMMDLAVTKAALQLANGRAMTEASGEINERSLVAIADTGVGIVPVGDLPTP